MNKTISIKKNLQREKRKIINSKDSCPAQFPLFNLRWSVVTEKYFSTNIGLKYLIHNGQLSQRSSSQQIKVNSLYLFLKSS